MNDVVPAHVSTDVVQHLNNYFGKFVHLKIKYTGVRDENAQRQQIFWVAGEICNRKPPQLGLVCKN